MLDDVDLKKLDGLFEKRLKPVKDDISTLHTEIAAVASSVDEKIEKRLKPVKDDISHIRKDVKVMTGFFDNEYLVLRKRVERIESFLKLTVS